MLLKRAKRMICFYGDTLKQDYGLSYCQKEPKPRKVTKTSCPFCLEVFAKSMCILSATCQIRICFFFKTKDLQEFKTYWMTYSIRNCIKAAALLQLMGASDLSSELQCCICHCLLIVLIKCLILSHCKMILPVSSNS